MIRSITKLTKKLRNQSLNEIKPDDQSIITQSNYVTTLEDLDDLDLFNETEDEEKDPDIHFSLTVDKSEEELINNYNSKQTHTTFVNNKENIVQVEDYGQTLPESPTDSKNELSPTRNHTNSPFSGSPKRSTGGEKRKFSRSSVCPYKMKTLKPSPTYHGDSSSDEEMKELYSKHKCSTQHASIIHTGLRGNRKIACITPLDIPRPSIDFEKQQETGKKLFKKQRPRIVKLKTLHSLKSREMMNDMVLFKPINLLSKVPTSSSSGTCFTPTSSILVPVEESVKNGFAF